MIFKVKKKYRCRRTKYSTLLKFQGNYALVELFYSLLYGSYMLFPLVCNMLLTTLAVKCTIPMDLKQLLPLDNGDR